MFLFKRKKIVVDAFIASKPIYDLFPLEKSSSFYPDWWKNLPSSFEAISQNSPTVEYPTIKRCDGFLSLYKSGFVLPLWSDLIIETDQDDSWRYVSSDSQLTITTHDRIAYGDEFKNHMHFKIMSPWVVTEKTGVNFIITNSWWNNVNQPIVVPNGVLEYKYQSACHVNFFVPKQRQRISLSAGTPIAQLIPLSEHDVEIKCHLIGNEEYDKMYSVGVYQNSFMSKYRKRKKIMQAKGICPFHRG